MDPNAYMYSPDVCWGEEHSHLAEKNDTIDLSKIKPLDPRSSPCSTGTRTRSPSPQTPRRPLGQANAECNIDFSRQLSLGDADEACNYPNPADYLSTSSAPWSQPPCAGQQRASPTGKYSTPQQVPAEQRSPNRNVDCGQGYPNVSSQAYQNPFKPFSQSGASPAHSPVKLNPYSSQKSVSPPCQPSPPQPTFVGPTSLPQDLGCAQSAPFASGQSQRYSREAYSQHESSARRGPSPPRTPIPRQDASPGRSSPRTRPQNLSGICQQPVAQSFPSSERCASQSPTRRNNSPSPTGARCKTDQQPSRDRPTFHGGVVPSPFDLPQEQSTSSTPISVECLPTPAELQQALAPRNISPGERCSRIPYIAPGYHPYERLRGMPEDTPSAACPSYQQQGAARSPTSPGASTSRRC